MLKKIEAPDRGIKSPVAIPWIKSTLALLWIRPVMITSIILPSVNIETNKLRRKKTIPDRYIPEG
jgi:hypothetical protein